MSFNPYQPPVSAYDGNYTNPDARAVVSDSIVASLRKTRPWVTLIAVLSFIAGGLMVLAGLINMTQSFMAGLVSLMFAAIYLLPGVALIRYSKAIDKLLHGGGVSELEQAVDAQASFWQLAGIITLVSMALTVVAVIAMAAFGASMLKGL